jgi:hypothetical protein
MSLEDISVYLHNANESELAKQVLDVFGKNAQSFEHFDDVSKCFFKIKDYDKSIKYGEKGISIASTPQQMYVMRQNLTNVYNHNNMPEKAMRYIKASEAVIKDDTDRDFEKAYAWFLMNKKQDAAKLLREKLNDPSLTDEQREKTEFNLGTYDLIDGNLQQGLKRFLLSDLRGTCSFLNQKHDNYGLPKWNGVASPGKNLLIIAEAGIGDELINIRFVKKLEKLGLNVIWLTLQNRQDLAEIYNLNGIKAFSDIRQVPKEFLENCNYTPSMHLPIHLNVKYKDLWTGVYVNNLPTRLDDKWDELLNSSKLKIGVRWQGNPEYDQDLHRSIPLKEILNHIPTGNEMYSIQRDTGLEQLTSDLIDLSTELKTLVDLFVCISKLDLVITSCTSIAHIASAMGKHVCVVVPISCYYVWCNPDNKNTWYGETTKIFYQQKPRSWKEPLEEMQKYLQDFTV